MDQDIKTATEFIEAGRGGHGSGSYNPEKCKVMHIGNEFASTYVMNDGCRLSLDAIVKEKDLGVHVMRDLKSQEQCRQLARKAQAVLGMVKRHIR